MPKIVTIIFISLLFVSLGCGCKPKKNTVLNTVKTTEQKDTAKPNINISKLFNVKDFGAKGDFIIDDTKSIQKCFNAIKKNGSGIAYFPKGIYKVSHANFPGKSWCLVGVNHLEIRGEDKENTIIKLAANQKNFTRILILENNKNININNITFDGNYSNQKNPEKPNEHLAGIFIDHTNDVIINNADFINTGGDGITIRGVKFPSKNIVISNCKFKFNKRSGITLGSGFDGVKIFNNYFGKNIKGSPIDTEPTAGICQNVIIENNEIYTPTLLTLGGPNYKNKGKNFLVQHNNLVNCSIFIVRGDSIIVRKNTIKITKARKDAITCIASNNNIYIQDNIIEIVNKSAIYLVKTAYSKESPNNIYITNNQIKVNGNVNCFDIRGANNIHITNNEITGINSNIGIYCFSNFKMNNIKIERNQIKGFKTGIKIVPLKKNPIKNISIENNQFISSKKSILKTGIDYKFNGRKELNLLENLSVKNNTFSKNIIQKIKKN